MKNEELTLIGVYLPTGQGIEAYENELISISSIIKDLEETQSPYIIFGDFNGDIHRAKETRNQDKALKTWYVNLNDKFGITWVSNLFTQKYNQTFKSGSCIDHIFISVNAKPKVIQVNILSNEGEQENLNNSDHNPIEITLNTDNKTIATSHEPTKSVTHTNTQPNKTSFINWTNKNIKTLYAEKVAIILKESGIIETCKQISLDNKEKQVEEAINILQSCLLKARNLLINELENRSKHINHKRRPKYKMGQTQSEELKMIYAMKDSFNKKWLTTRNYAYREIYNRYRARARRMEKTLAKQSENYKAKQLSMQFKANRVKMWKSVTSSIKNKTEVDVNLDTLAESYEETFANKQQVSTLENSCIEANEQLYKSTANNEGTIKIRLEIISDIINRLKNKKAIGISDVSNEMFKHGGKPLAIVVCTLITKIVNVAYSPSCLNTGLTFPIIKDARKSNQDLNNTRPITVSDTLAIIFEKYLLIKIEDAWEDNELQFGFKKNCSTNHAIFLLRETLIRNKNRNKQSYLCFMDFSKAFDKVVRAILFSKLSKILDTQHWSTLYSYYSNSWITVSNKGMQGRKIRTTTGVKQGGPLSPKLFSIYVTEMVDNLIAKKARDSRIEHNIILYADDTVLIHNNLAELQKSIDEISKYCDIHGIKINANKTKCMIIGKRSDVYPKISINNENLEFVNKFKYLGWWLEYNLDSREHIKARKLAATVASYQLRKIGFHNENMTPELKVLLRNAYCRSKLNYAIENTYLNTKDYLDLNTLECKILKASLGFNRQHSNTLLNSALNITPLERQIKIRKIKFVQELMLNKTTANVIDEYISNSKLIPKKSTIKEVITICEINNTVENITELKESLRSKENELKEETRVECNSDTAQTIGYLLKRNTKQSKEILNRILHWENSRGMKQDLKKRKSRAA